MDTKIIGRVYKLTSSHTDEVYIGSTVQELSDRLREHKYSYSKYIDDGLQLCIATQQSLAEGIVVTVVKSSQRWCSFCSVLLSWVPCCST